MAKSKSDSDNTIEALLERRAQYEQWLARLDATVEKAPTAVRDRVRGDYEARLRGVMDELRGHSATIRQELEQHRATQSKLSAERQSAEEALAEAEVRYAVGEYGDDEWQRLNGESQRHLDQLRSELDAVGSEIARLAEVQAIISGSAARPAEPTSAEVSASAPAAMPLASAPQPLASPSPTPVAFERDPFEPLRLESMPTEPTPVETARVAEPMVAPAPAIDELAFLKSVSDEDQPLAPPSRRPSSPPATAAKAIESAPVAPIVSAPVPTPVAVPAPPMPVPSAPSAAAPGKTAGMAKTLKCNECGTLNRPTEWYCERCGAELAAL